MRRLAFIQEKQMIFSTYQFIFLFLPVTFFVYFLLNRFRYYSIAKIWLVLTSLYFYGQGTDASVKSLRSSVRKIP